MKKSPYFKLAKEKSKREKETFYHLRFDEFLAALKTYYNPQKYGPTIEKFVGCMFNLVRIGKKSPGDFEVKMENLTQIFNRLLSGGESIEFKVSYAGEGEEWNLVQLRPHDKFDYYLFLLIDVEEDCEQEWFLIKKRDFDTNENIPFTLAHGTKDNTKNNETIEYRVSLFKNSFTHEELQRINLIESSQIKLTLSEEQQKEIEGKPIKPKRPKSKQIN